MVGFDAGGGSTSRQERRYIGIDPVAEYVEQARWRLTGVACAPKIVKSLS